MHRYRTIKIPEELIETIIDLIKDYSDLGYRSHSEFLIDAARRRVEELISTFKKKSHD